MSALGREEQGSSSLVTCPLGLGVFPCGSLCPEKELPVSLDGGLRTSDRTRWERLLVFAGYRMPATVQRDLIVLLSHSASQYSVWAIMIPSFNIRKPRHRNSWEICQRHTALCLPCSQVCARDGCPLGVLPPHPQPQGNRGDQNPEQAGTPVLPSKQVKSSAPRGDADLASRPLYPEACALSRT